ncbi:hypothetical protein B0H63DRAFT_448308 [Podospora didyma]|uniref:Uncharacterized protein n=1 Tax=Podospora didyma TaxID=330526 RepID=A0AAE0NU29_9PEZI|nr:hypothetical protein B0H63DRAFT_448308 [Podospora didyma]
MDYRENLGRKNMFEAHEEAARTYITGKEHNSGAPMFLPIVAQLPGDGGCFCSRMSGSSKWSNLQLYLTKLTYLTSTANTLDTHLMKLRGPESIHASSAGGFPCFEHRPVPAVAPEWVFVQQTVVVRLSRVDKGRDQTRCKQQTMTESDRAEHGTTPAARATDLADDTRDRGSSTGEILQLFAWSSFPAFQRFQFRGCCRHKGIPYPPTTLNLVPSFKNHRKDQKVPTTKIYSADS